MVVLGCTGSIGVNTLKIAKDENLEIEALSCFGNIELLNQQISEFNPKFVCVGNKQIKNLVRGIDSKNIFIGQDGILDMLSYIKSNLVVNSIVGFAGLAPTLHAQKLGKKIALANKESLVVGGKFIDCKKISAIDSEHFGLWFLSKNNTEISKLIITASGGAFYSLPKESLNNVTAQMALKHPNWNMGAKITIDSATMANKLFEIIEAYWLSGIKNIDAFIERTSIVHALIEFIDGSTTAHLCVPDMKLAIAHAIFSMNNKIVDHEILKHISLDKLLDIKFEKIDLDKYPIFSLKDMLLENGDLGVVINAANEICVKYFLDCKCGFLDISRVVIDLAYEFKDIKIKNESDLFEIDREIRQISERKINAKV